MVEFHQPVLLKEVLQILNVKKGKKYIDATFGGGGHTFAILKKGSQVLGIDCDPGAINYIRKNKQFPITNKTFQIACGNFKNLEKIAKKRGFEKVAGIVFDLGLSSWQIEKSGRGFSFQKDEPLDMRADLRLKNKASDLINKLSKEELYEIFTQFGEELSSLPIAKAIIGARSLNPLKTTRQLAKVVEDCLFDEWGKIRPELVKKTKRRIFQALRIAVNNELENFKKGLVQSLKLLDKEGKIVVLTYHSLEDRIVKQFFLKQEQKGLLKILTKRPIRPTYQEIKKNPRAKGAKLRAAVLLCET